jgi:hypothetical protein
VAVGTKALRARLTEVDRSAHAGLVSTLGEKALGG